jgi:hypothetical protein
VALVLRTLVAWSGWSIVDADTGMPPGAGESGR